MIRRRPAMAGALIGLALAQASCARLACEWEWHLTMAPKMAPLRDVDRLTARERQAGLEAFKRDFVELCATQ